MTTDDNSTELSPKFFHRHLASRNKRYSAFVPHVPVPLYFPVERAKRPGQTSRTCSDRGIRITPRAGATSAASKRRRDAGVTRADCAGLITGKRGPRRDKRESPQIDIASSRGQREKSKEPGESSAARRRHALAEYFRRAKKERCTDGTNEPPRPSPRRRRCAGQRCDYRGGCGSAEF